MDYTGLRLTRVEDSAACMRLLKSRMRADFPKLNMIPFVFQKRALRQGKLQASYLSDGNIEYGYAVYHRLQHMRVTQIMYLAILPEYRSHGLGGRFIELLRGVNDGDTLLLEVDEPDGQDGDRTRRIAFYQRSGFNVIPGITINVLAHLMLVMADKPLKTDWAKLYKDVYCMIYGTSLFRHFVKVYEE